MNKKFASYEEWIELERCARPANLLVECVHCDGDGESTCDCDCPNCEAEVHCDDCDGEGIVPWGDLSEHEQNEHLSRRVYIEKLKEDFILLADWIGRLDEALLLDAGLEGYPIYQDIETRSFSFYEDNHRWRR